MTYTGQVKFPNGYIADTVIALSVDENGNIIPISAGGSGGDGLTDEQLRASPVPVTVDGGGGDPDMTAITVTGGSVVDAILFTQDMTDYAAVIFQATGPFVGTLIFEGSNDQTTWAAIPAYNNTVVRAFSTTSVGLFTIFGIAKYVRVRMSARTSGTAAGVAFAVKAKGLIAGSVDILANGTAMATPGSSNSDAAPSINGGLLKTDTYTREWNGLTFDRKRKASGKYRRIGNSGAFTIKASAGDLKAMWGDNTSAVVMYIQFYEKATDPTPGTDTPVMTYTVQPNSYFEIPIPQDGGIYFPNGIAVAFTTDNVAIPTTAAGGNIANFGALYA